MIRLYTGRDSQKKREHIYNLIKNPSTVITPEQSTLIIEKEILAAKKVVGLIDVRITSFKKIIDTLNNDIFDNSKEHITDVGKQMLFRYILKDKASELRLFSSVSDKEGFVEEIIYTIETLESEGIDPEVLLDITGDDIESSSRDKLHDIYIIYSEYLARIKDKYFHISEGIDKFNKYAHTFDVYSREHVWILGFKAFDKKALTMIESISKHTKHLNIVISYEEDEIYSASKNTIDILRSIFDLEVVSFKTPEDTFSRFASHLIKGEPYPDIKNVRLLKTADMYSEVEYVALDMIKKFNEDDSLVPEDFRVVVGSDSYNTIIESTFGSMNLPIFSDTRRHIINSKLVKTIISLIRIYVYDFRRDDVVSFLKGYIQESNWDALDAFDNYTFEHGIDRASFFKEFKEPTIEELRKEYLLEIIHYRREFQTPSSPKRFSEKLIELLNKLQFLDSVLHRMETMDEDKKDIITQVYNKVFEIIAQIHIVSNDDKIPFAKYLDYFKTAIKDVSVGVIPPTDGAIVIASVSRSVHSSCKYLYVLGVSDGVIPKDYRDEDLLKENEKLLINSRGYNVLSSNYNRMLIDRLDENTMLSFVSEDILFSSSGIDITGETMMESRYIKLLEESGVKAIDGVTSNHYLSDRYYYNESIKYRYIVDSVKSGGRHIFINADRGYVDTIINSINRRATEIFITKEDANFKTSVSRLELYNRCPFAYFIKYELKANELKEYSIDAMLKGTFLHEVLEVFFKEGYHEVFDVRSSIEKIVEHVISREEYSVFHNSFRNIDELRRAKETLVFIARTLSNKMKSSHFKAKRFEEEINVKETHYILQGKIDRIDIFDNYFSIIDYKSGNKEIKLEELYHGLSLQLPLYLDAYSNIHALKPAGMFYVQVKNHFSDEKHKREDLVKLNGLLIGGKYIAERYDSELGEKKKSTYIDVAFKKDGDFSAYSKVISSDEAMLLIKKAKQHANNSSKAIISGDMSVKPVSGIMDACEYCHYRSICRRDELFMEHKIEAVDKKKVFDMLEEEFEVDESTK